MACKHIKLVHLTPVLAQNVHLITPRTLWMDILVAVIHAWFMNNSYFSVFSQFRINTGKFSLKIN